MSALLIGNYVTMTVAIRLSLTSKVGVCFAVFAELRFEVARISLSVCQSYHLLKKPASF